MISPIERPWRSHRNTGRGMRCRKGLAHVLRLACVVSCLIGTTATAADGLDPVQPSFGDDPVFSIGTGFGPIEYRAGRGIHFGNTGLNIGGFTTVEFEREDGDVSEVALDGFNILALWQPLPSFRLFTDIEIDDIASWESGTSSVETQPGVVAERLFADFIADDSFTARVGQFQTPVGRWNLVPAEPFVWTPQEPAIVEFSFDDLQTGASALGSFYPTGGIINYWLYSQFLDRTDLRDLDQVDRSWGGRVEFDRTLGHWSVGASFLASEQASDWSYLGGLDAQWFLGPLELTSELIIQDGDVKDRRVWGIYGQAVLEVLPTFYLVGRYEHYDPLGGGGNFNIGDLGVAWKPKHWLHIKGSYRLTDHENDDIVRGLKATISVIF